MRDKSCLSHCVLALCHTQLRNTSIIQMTIRFRLNHMKKRCRLRFRLSHMKKRLQTLTQVCVSLTENVSRNKPSSTQILCEILYVLIQIYKGNQFTFLANSEFTMTLTRILPRQMPPYLTVKELRQYHILLTHFSKSDPWTKGILIFSNGRSQNPHHIY